jgi:transcriptional regulator with XRE-family HTH domain
MEFVERLGRSGRLALLEVAAKKRTYRDLARIMGVSPAAVSKYMSGRMAPSDAAVARLLESLDTDEAREVAILILNYLAEGLRDFIQWASSKGLIKPGEAERILLNVQGVTHGAPMTS